MVTAILPSMTYKAPESLVPTATQPQAQNGASHGATPSISSELTITPARYTSRSNSPTTGLTAVKTEASPAPKLAGIVGMLTGCGALVALLLFLPLPTRFQDGGASRSQSVADSFYVVGAVALVVSVGCLFGLRNLSGEEGKGLKQLLKLKALRSQDTIMAESRLPSYSKLFQTAVLLGFKDVNIGLGYVGGFVARASSVAISLFIPLYVNAYFISSGICPEDPTESTQDPSIIKRNCQRAYIVASILTGVSQLIALLCAPVFGYLSSVYTTHNVPLLLASASGVAGYAAFGKLKSPDPKSDDGSFGVFFIVALLGISQIGAIVCSLSLLAKGIETEAPVTAEYFAAPTSESTAHATNGRMCATNHESASTPLLPSHLRHIGDSSGSRAALKGSIAGIYSLGGGAGILLLTKLGGLMFDKVDVGSPFYMMAIFNAVLFIVTMISDFRQVWKAKRVEERPLSGVLERDEQERYRDEG